MPIRKIGVISRTYRHINRYREIIAILVKYGFGEVLAKLELQKHLDLLFFLVFHLNGTKYRLLVLLVF